MNKQEEIDWGLRNLIRELTNEDGTMFLYKASIKIRDYLHSKGVVIKTGLEWCTQHGYPIPCRKCGAKHGQSTIEPLIGDLK